MWFQRTLTLNAMDSPTQPEDEGLNVPEDFYETTFRASTALYFSRTDLDNDEESRRLLRRVSRPRQPNIEEVFKSPTYDNPAPLPFGDSYEMPIRNNPSGVTLWDNHTPPRRRTMNYEPPIQGTLFKDSPEGSSVENSCISRSKSGIDNSQHLHKETRDKKTPSDRSFKFFYDENLSQFIDLKRDAGQFIVKLFLGDCKYADSLQELKRNLGQLYRNLSFTRSGKAGPGRKVMKTPNRARTSLDSSECTWSDEI